MSLLAAVLAGGEGRRIGGGKPFRRLGGETLLTRALRIASTWSDEVALVVRDARSFEAPTGVLLLTDAPGIEGPLAGLAAALVAARRSGQAMVQTLPCDTPFLPEDLPHRLREAAGVGVVLPRSGGRLHPACGLWSLSVEQPLLRYALEGGRSLRGLAECVGFGVVDWPDQPDLFANINTEPELAAAERRVTSS